MHENLTSSSNILTSAKTLTNETAQLIPVGNTPGNNPGGNAIAQTNRHGSGKPTTARPIMNGDTVIAVEVQCKCGEKIVLECQYE